MPSITRSFVAIPKDVREWTRFFESLFFSNTCTLSLSGCTTVPSADVRYSVSAGVVVLDIPSITGVSNSTDATLSTLPEQLRPKTAKTAIARVQDNSVTDFGMFGIGTDGVITLYPSASGVAVFAAANDKGVLPCSVTYEID